MRDLGAFVEDNFLNDDCCSGHPVDLGKTGLSTAGSLSSETSLCSFPVPCGDKIGRKSQRVKAAATQESHTCRISSVCVTNVPSTNGTVVGVNGVPKVKYDDVFSSAQAEESTWSSKRTTYKRPRVTPSFSAASSCSTDGARRRRELLASLPPPSNKLPNNLLGGGSILCFDASRIANQSADKAFPKSPETLGTKEESRSSRALAEESGDAGTVEGDICKADKQEKGGASLSSLFTLYDSDNDDAQSSEGKSAANQRAVLPEVKKEEKYCDGMSGPEPFVNIPSASCGGDTSALQKEEFEGSPSHRLQNPTSYSAVDDICAHIGVPAELVKASGLTAGEVNRLRPSHVSFYKHQLLPGLFLPFVAAVHVAFHLLCV